MSREHMSILNILDNRNRYISREDYEKFTEQKTDLIIHIPKQ